MRSLVILAVVSIIACMQFPSASATIETTVTPTDSVLQLAIKYQVLLKKIEAETGRTSLEPLVDFQNQFSERLREVEELSEKDFKSFEKHMRGFLVNRDEIIFVKPDNEFFLRLAKKRGLPADIAFFELRNTLRPDGVWSAYTLPQTDYSGCTRFGTGKLTELYGRLNSFKENFPTSYIQITDEELGYVVEDLTVGTCACEDSRSATKEFELFLKTYPGSTIAPKIKDRLSGTDEANKIRPNCISG